MRIYVDPAFIDSFLELPKNSSKAVEILWNIIENYAEIEWVFSEKVSYEDFEKWEVSSKFYTSIISKGSNNIIFNKSFLTEILDKPNDSHIILTSEFESWHDQIRHNAIILTSKNFEQVITKITKNLSFRFLADENRHFDKFAGLRSDKVSEITLTDKYIIAQFLKTGDKKKLDKSFIYLLTKLLPQNFVNINILIKSPDADGGKTEELERKLDILVAYCKERITENLSLKIINAELDYEYDFHDRNIFSKYYIVKSGKGFEINYRANINGEIECYSFLDKWGYDLIRHRTKMYKNYLEGIRGMNNVFTIFKS